MIFPLIKKTRIVLYDGYELYLLELNLNKKTIQYRQNALSTCYDQSNKNSLAS